MENGCQTWINKSKILTLTVFTPTFNRARTLQRLYESLVSQTCMDFEWMIIDDGSTDNTGEQVKGFIRERKISIRYIHKENGGLYTGYNTAYENIDTELCVCLDSDDFMPANAVELIVEKWRKNGSDEYCGIVGLDFYAGTQTPIAGYFPDGMRECYYLDLYIKNIHRGDSKYVMRTQLMKEVAPMEGFPGEKDFNPGYMFLKVCDDRPLLVLNENLCFVDYRSGDNMSAAIWMQYRRSPKSFAKMRELEMGLKRSTLLNRYRSGIHYVADSLLARNYSFLRETKHKLPVTVSILPGCLLYFLILFKTQAR